ncbi:hypothetical protein CN135_32155 [Sinorhizobium meliloti]|uniref:hypothetical protein n=1 Tax=Rhizobium meliloti TaxID=382 RepID=UPI000FD88CD7|nr:hypothetical protein [Sinorhizobium meliloti]RVL70416.1 hypothetical protein CN135_32155 [Sinorhizobium meliloti]
MAARRKRKITFIESDETPENIRKSLPKKNLFEVDLFIRKPDKVDTDEFSVAARLCRCRRVCLAFIDPD